jgi:hypothetical protein
MPQKDRIDLQTGSILLHEAERITIITGQVSGD